MNTNALYLDNENNQGIDTVNDARVIPIPNVTIKAGRAQQKSVPREVKSDKVLSRDVFVSVFVSMNCRLK